jgi:hypothetical protein
VIEGERYGIAAPDGAQHEAELRRCVADGSAERAPPQISPTAQEPDFPPPWAQPAIVAPPDEVALQVSDSGRYRLPVTINGTLSVPFVLDTGADGVVIPIDVFSVMLRQGTVSADDIKGQVTVTMADGSSRKEPVFHTACRTDQKPHAFRGDKPVSARCFTFAIERD